MKFKYFFALILILTIIFSFGTVMANEDVNASSAQDDYLYVDDQSMDCANEDILLSDDANHDSDLICEDSPSDDKADLSVDMELGDMIKKDLGFGKATFEVPMIITAKAINGTAKNVKVNVTMPEFFSYISHAKTVGEYDSESGIWNIGDLTGGANATLTILTNISAKGTHIISVDATTDSMDKVSSNNYLECIIEVNSKITSNTTRTSVIQDPSKNRANTTTTSEDRKTQHDPHQNSAPKSGGRITQDDNHQESSSSSKNVVKDINPNIFSNAVKSIGGTVEDLLNPDSTEDEEDSNGSLSAVKAIGVNDHMQILLLIFALFLIALVGIFAYDKIKS
ncbi:MAG: DUF11 domain-containing protein [Methanobrevibacter sp.]|nr:DUF11 domain-containing protein [Methanobrevibacter sp.]